jgi:hypothetical protein
MKAVALLLTGMLLPAADLRIDHVSVAGKSLKSMQEQLAAVGIDVEPGGRHTNRATEMGIASFPDGSYLELIALQPSFDAAMLAQHPWARFIQGDAGPAAWAVRPKDFDAEVTRLRATGVAVRTAEGGRQRPDGFGLQWQTAAVGDEGTGLFFPFLIQDKTPRDKRAYPAGKPSNRDETGILRVVVAVRKLPDAVERFHRAYPDLGHPLKEVDAKFGAELAWLPDTPVIFAAPLGASSWVAQRIDKFGEGPCAFVLGSKKNLKREWKQQSRWFGRDVKWFDADELGWRLGAEQL